MAKKITCEAWLIERLVEQLDAHISHGQHEHIYYIKILHRDIQRVMMRMVQHEQKSFKTHDEFIHDYVCSYTILHPVMDTIIVDICRDEIQHLHHSIAITHNDVDVDLYQYELYYIEHFLRTYFP